MILPAAAVAAACGSITGNGASCVEEATRVPLDPALGESSGVAVSLRDPGVFWTHNDSGDDPVVYAVDREGSLLGSVRLEGAGARDWEDIETAACSGGSCVYVADTGDNEEVRETLTVYRAAEPRVGDTEVAAEALPVILPDGPRDVEALFVLPGEGLHLVTKGRSDPITVYRYPPPLRPGEAVELEEAQRLTTGSVSLGNQVTGAAAAPSGDLVALRTYRQVDFYRVGTGPDLLVPVGSQRLTTLDEPQGEGVGLGPDGLVALTSEAVRQDERASLALMRCSPPGE